MTPQEAVTWAGEFLRNRPTTGVGPLTADAAAGHLNDLAAWSWATSALGVITLDGSDSYTVLEGSLPPRFSHLLQAQMYTDDQHDLRDLLVVGTVPSDSAWDELPTQVEAKLSGADLDLKVWPNPTEGKLLTIVKQAHSEITVDNWNDEASLDFPRELDYVYRLFVLYYVLLYGNDQRAGFVRPAPGGQGFEMTGVIGHAHAAASVAARARGVSLTASGVGV